MLSIEQSLIERVPWLAQYPRLRRPVAGALERLADERGFNRVLARAGEVQGLDFVARVLDLLGTSYHVDAREREHIPVDGPLLVVANHPLGMQDALTLLDLIGSVRADVRMLGNDWLSVVPQLGGLLLSVDVFGHGARSRMREVFRALEQGQALILFPAGEVSRMGSRGVRDGAWSDGFARLARRLRVPVLPIHLSAHNSAWFYGVSMLAKPLSTAMLPREAVAAGRRRIAVSVGALIGADELRERSADSPRQAARLMRRHVYRLPHHRALVFGGQAPLAHPESPDEVAAELAQADKLADLHDGKQAWLYRGPLEGAVLREIGRLRELTFRRVGEGTGARRDLDAWDALYEHLVVWDPSARRIVGAYRFGLGARLITEHGMAGFYTSSLFTYSPALEARLSQGMELGRSFVAPAYWRSRALDQLWQGIGLYLQRHREVRYLFGPVSMSIAMPREAREWIVAAHEHYFGVPGMAAPRQPFIPSSDVAQHVRETLEGLDAAAGLGRLRQHLDALGVSLPVLYRQYVDLVEPSGVQFLGFGEDPAFAGCVDGLVMLDLADLKPAKRARYLGGAR